MSDRETSQPLYVTRVTVEGRHVTPPVVFVFDIDELDINGFRHGQLVEVAYGFKIIATSMIINPVRDELEGYVEDAATFERLSAWVTSGTEPGVRLVSAPTP